MEEFSEIEPVRSFIHRERSRGKKIGFVPTMGALHEGHLSLIRIARENSDIVIVSIYVNPEQFGPNEDFEEYPRSLKDDLDKCKDSGVDAVFTPSDQMMYGEGKYLEIQINELNRHMDGGSRPGFFEGVLLIVNKLFNIIQPDIAVFGQKDIQQCRILQQMVGEFNHDVKLIMGEIVRANDGLALSSRNSYLSAEERKISPGLYRCLKFIHKQILDDVTTPGLMIEHQKSELEAKGFKIDYLDVFAFTTLEPVNTLDKKHKYILAGAVWLGNTRLIDNILIEM
jgi:pantoate--beta-alanine ligase